MRVLADAQAMQGAITGERGIGRYTAELARHLEARHPGVVESWVLRPGQPVPVQVPDLLWRSRLRFADDPDHTVPDVWHVTSPFESPELPVDAVWPAWARSTRTRLYVTLYDLIPLVFPETYLADVTVRSGYAERLQLVQAADRVLAISEATARDAVRLLDVPASRIDVVGTGLATGVHPGPAGAAPRERPAPAGGQAGVRDVHGRTRLPQERGGPAPRVRTPPGRAPPGSPAAGRVPHDGPGACRSGRALRGSRDRGRRRARRIRAGGGARPAVPGDGALRLPVAVRGFRPPGGRGGRVRRAGRRRRQLRAA